VNVLQIWDPNRSNPQQELTWSEDSLMTVRFNPVETHLVATTGEDRTVTLFDLRGNTPIKKLVLEMKSNCFAWNPMEAFSFTVGNEDHNCYTFDMRNLGGARNVHEDHVAAIISIDYSPTGKEFTTGSYDKTLRIFKTNEGHSREVYFTRRMQRLFSVLFSGDSRFVFSGSDDTNIRIWKANAAENLSILNARQMQKQNYQDSLIQRYKEMPEIRKIHRHRFLPKAIKYAQSTKGIMKRSRQRKVANLRRHSAPGKVPYQSLRNKKVVAVQS